VSYAWKVGVKHTAIYWLEGPIFKTVRTSFCVCICQNISSKCSSLSLCRVYWRR